MLAIIVKTTMRIALIFKEVAVPPKTVSFISHSNGDFLAVKISFWR